MSRSRLVALATALSCALVLGATGTAAAATTTTPIAKTIPVTGATKSGKTLKHGTFTIQRFAKKNGKLVAIGTMKGRIGGRSFTRTVRMPASRPTTGSAQSSQLPPLPNACQILNLRLGPINLNLLGLVVRTNRINVRIDAVPGPGNLLGNLLCGITGLLDQNALANSPLGQLANILNSLLALAPRTA
jgi:hypothetical protein